ncbi:GntR family transcriptional regulator [Filifactor villosus]|uniref:GntR family transcriptional regulator n=1 Tax=Filifactor villosus TaxID=29374 RepID=A0ABV9QLH3_9FIRM
MTWVFDEKSPIYLQLMDYLKKQIMSGELQGGQKILSVRELAKLAGVNPNTMQKALSELEREKLIYSERTAGRFVTKDIELIEQKRKDLARKYMEDFITSLKELGYTKEQIRALLDDLFEGGK